MKQTTKYVGLDVHQATTVATVRSDTGRVLSRSILPTEAVALRDWLQGRRGAIHVALEEGTQAQWLHDLLAPVVARVIVCDRRGEPSRGNKGDAHDADELSELLRCQRLRAVYHGSPERATLRDLARAYQNLVEDATRVMLRLKALYRARGIRTPGHGVYDAAQRAEWLGKLPAGGARFRAVAVRIEGVISHCRYPLNTGFPEGMNNKIKVLKRMAYGYRDDDYFFLKIRATFPGIP